MEMEMEGRGYNNTDFYRNTSEEMFIKNMMDSSIGIPAPPTMEMLGFKNLSQSFRADSEELFKSWLTNYENNGGIAHRTRQASRRISAEASNLSNQQPGGLQKKRTEEILLEHNISLAGESSSEPNELVAKNGVDMGLQASNLFLAKAWFNSSQPMTRSRSSELRRRYVQQNSYTSIGIEAMNNMNNSDANHFKQEQTDVNGYGNVPMCEVPNHLMTSFMSPSNSSSCTFNTQQAGNVDNISSVVNMLKGTLERKRLYNNVEKDAVEESSFGYFESEDAFGATGLNQGQGNNVFSMQGNFQDLSQVQFTDTGVLQTNEGSYGLGPYGVAAANTNHFQRSTMSREPSQSESSAATPVVSTGFDTCDGPSISGQAPSVSNGSRKHMANGNGPRTKAEQGDPTKKRRVERSRKMAEAKERNLTPAAVTSDMQSLLKRCENLEKEVRSLKLNLAFMNRKDSEQTKQTEDLQKQNENLSKEKGRLLEEIERIISGTRKM